MKAPMMPATMKWHEAIPMAPAMRIVLRPNLSTYITAGMVNRNSSMPTTPVARRERVLPVIPKPWKMNGLRDVSD